MPWVVYTNGGFGKPKTFKLKKTATNYAVKTGENTIYKVVNLKRGDSKLIPVPIRQTNSGLLTKLRKGVRGFIKIKNGRLEIRT